MLNDSRPYFQVKQSLMLYPGLAVMLAVLGGRQLPLGQQGGKRAWREIRGGLLAYVPQDPLTGLNPVLKVGSQLEEAVRVRGKLSGHDCRNRVLELLGRVKIPAPFAGLPQLPPPAVRRPATAGFTGHGHGRPAQGAGGG
jgi:hypothetical protein